MKCNIYNEEKNLQEEILAENSVENSVEKFVDNGFVYADAHCDSVQVATPWRLACGCRASQLDFPRLVGQAKLQFMACFLGADVMSLPQEEAWRRFRQQLLDLRFAAELCPDVELLNDWRQAGKSSKVQLVPAVEGLDFLAGDWRRVDDLWAQGIRSFGLFWNDDSFLGCGAMTVRDRGLTGSGRELVRHLAREARLVDLAHAAERSFWQAADILAGAGRPLFVSHTAARALCEHTRNLTDEQIKAVAASGGVVGLCLVPRFLRAGGVADGADIGDFVRHAAHIAELVGAEHLVMGSDFDGTEHLPQGVAGVEDVPKLYMALISAGFAEGETRGIMGENLLKFLQKY